MILIETRRICTALNIEYGGAGELLGGLNAITDYFSRPWTPIGAKFLLPTTMFSNSVFQKPSFLSPR